MIKAFKETIIPKLPSITSPTQLLPSASSAPANQQLAAKTQLFQTISLFLTTLTIHTLSTKKMNLVSKIYDSVIVHMTEKWYQCVLSQLDDNCVVLDVGIGTAAALLHCEEIIKAKNLQIIGIDYNPYYISSAQKSIEEANLTQHISVHCIDLYDKEKLQKVMEESTKDSKVDCIYFSGSFSLLPDPKGALLMTIPLLRKQQENTLIPLLRKQQENSSSCGLVYITQTYQRHVFPLLGSIKPMLKYLTTIDFGQLVKEDEVLDLLKNEELVSNGIVLKSHEVIEGSLDNYWQAAYLSILKVDGQK